jgi:hypothetical protein
MMRADTFGHLFRLSTFTRARAIRPNTDSLSESVRHPRRAVMQPGGRSQMSVLPPGTGGADFLRELSVRHRTLKLAQTMTEGPTNA